MTLSECRVGDWVDLASLYEAKYLAGPSSVPTYGICRVEYVGKVGVELKMLFGNSYHFYGDTKCRLLTTS